ncbi:enoyl-CoA hydratase/isomerase family protein [Pelagibacterium sediminicola]|uniref:enoyl-CoA hydratase/isomerase family protein n=1 Tax=Pelagibacterium sediminicola TaxID=2248761 RepID=UPI000E3118D4|nr:enoyl-CoA hydratase/isomerase family protein [Pelagibacterium sediminicola]
MKTLELIALSKVSHGDKSYARLRLNRPQARNALNNQLAQDLYAACAEIAADGDVSLAVIEAEGSVFCAGADVKERAALDEDQVRARRLRGFRAYASIEALPMPVICVVDGACVGSGCEIALASDFIIASDRASFRTPEARWGTVGATQRLSRAIGLRRAKQLMFTGQTIDAARAERWGLVNEVVPAADLERTVENLLAEMLQAPKTTLRLAKRAMVAGFEDSRHGALAHEIYAIEDNLDEGDWKSGMQQALRK